MHASAQARAVGLTVVAAVLGLLTVSCGSGSGSGSSGTQPESSASRATAEHGYEAAYDAGWHEGRRIFKDGGKGSAIREVVWGGCVRRSLTAEPQIVVEKDRGAWVLGCKQGVGTDKDRHPPASPVTRREADPDLLARFRSWADTNGFTRPARDVGQVVLVHLGDGDYDVELSTAYTERNTGAEVRRLADAFVIWWDGDDGDKATAGNLIVAAQDGKRLVTVKL
jgi:hypothetical protein